MIYKSVRIIFDLLLVLFFSLKTVMSVQSHIQQSERIENNE